MIITELRTRLQEAGFGARYADATEALAQRCLRFNAIPCDEGALPIGCSKLGGFPDLPVGIPWPLHGGRSLTHVAQIDHSDTNPYSFCRDLPAEGHSSFFLDLGEQPEGYDPGDRGNWRVIYHPGPREELERRVRPESGVIPVHFNPCRIVFHEALSPGWDKIPFLALLLGPVRQDEYQNFIDSLPDEEHHQILGRPGRIEDLQYPMRLECQYISQGLQMSEPGKPVDEAKAREVAPGAQDWKLLLQLDSDEGAGMDWGDSMVSFWIKEKDLRERNFSEVWEIDEWF
jgi:uncharacterized protein YwqG